MGKETEQKVSALATLCELRDGRTVVELEQCINEVAEAVRKTGKVGSLTLKLTFKPYQKGKAEEEVQVLGLEDAIAMKLPQLDRGTTVFFSSAEGLSRQNPQQMSLTDLKEVDAPQSPAAPLRVVDGGKGNT